MPEPRLQARRLARGPLRSALIVGAALVVLLVLPSAGAQGCTPSAGMSVEVLETIGTEPTKLLVRVYPNAPVSGGDRLTGVRFTSVTNGSVELNGLTQAVPASVSIPPNTVEWSFVFRKAALGGSFMVAFVLTDLCGDVPKFAGAGPDASPAAAPTATATRIPTPTSTPRATAALTSAPTATATPTTAPTRTATPTPVTGSKDYGVNVSGAEFGQAQPGTEGIDYIYATDSARPAYFAGKGLKLVRIPFGWERVQRSAFGSLSTSDVARLQAMLDAAAGAGQRALLDMHNFGRYYGTPLTRADAAKLNDVWSRLARQFRGHPGLYGYELMNEPHDLPEGSDGWAFLAQSATDAIRREDSSAWVLIPGYFWQSAMFWQDFNASLAVNDSAGRLLYAAHVYFDQDGSGEYSRSYDAEGAYPDRGVDRARPFQDWLAGRNARGIFTEYGIPDTDTRWLDVLRRMLAALDADPRIQGGTYWSSGPWWGSYPLSVEPYDGRDHPQMQVLVQFPSR